MSVIESTFAAIILNQSVALPSFNRVSFDLG